MKKKNDMYTCALIVAAGKGTRMNTDISKQYIDIAGKPLIAWTIEAFEDCEYIDEIVLVVSRDDIVYCKQNIVDVYGKGKIRSIVAGGVTRQESVSNGLCEVSGQCEIVLIHDGARPFVREETIIESIFTASETGASCVAVPVKDTIKSSDWNGFIDNTLNREFLWSVQTPQTFKYDLILNAHKLATEEGIEGTDDSVLVERTGHKVKLVMGSYDNIKITTPEDLPIAETIIKSREL